ncbi:hypothetical protein JCM21900_003688 [Sporobolomyces salmonicolor]
MTASKPYDILVLGAGGFTGQLVSRYLANEAVSQNFKLAVGGRNREKIERRMKEVGVTADILVVDAKDEPGLRQVIKQVKVVVSLVGPYMYHGELIYKCCAELGVHHCDLSGETPFVYNMIQKYTRSALSSKAILVNAAGYDSIPSDLCTFLAVQRLKKIGGDSTKAGLVRSGFTGKGGISGGTFASLIGLVEADKEDQQVTINPYALSPIEGKHKPSPVLAGSSTFRGKRSWGSFFVMAPFNTAIVRRSWGIFESADPSSRVLSYGPNFDYDEYFALPGPISSFLVSVALYLSFASLFLSPIRWLAKKFGPKSGDGPSKETQETGWFETVCVAKSDDGKYETKVTMKGKGDPGYAATSVMISECALALLKDHDRLPPIAKHGGPLTPATALGNVLVERLEKTGRFSFTVEDEETKSQ